MINRVSSVLPQTTLLHLTKLNRYAVCIKPALPDHLVLATLKTQPKLFSTGHRRKESKERVSNLSFVSHVPNYQQYQILISNSASCMIAENLGFVDLMLKLLPTIILEDKNHLIFTAFKRQLT